MPHCVLRCLQKEGDLWYFPPGFPHSLQATNATEDGAEFLLVFPDGAFSDDTTFLLTDWLAHIPKEVLAKNFQTDISAFDYIPGEQLYIFPAGTSRIMQWHHLFTDSTFIRITIGRRNGGI
jgi:oxalate decarboxylase/phosphoglucose isomerase-like protein (cupin superfamily)